MGGEFTRWRDRKSFSYANKLNTNIEYWIWIHILLLLILDVTSKSVNDQTKSTKEDASKKTETGKVTSIQSIFQFFNVRKPLFVIKLNLKVKEPKALTFHFFRWRFLHTVTYSWTFPLRGKRDIIIQQWISANKLNLSSLVSFRVRYISILQIYAVTGIVAKATRT